MIVTINSDATELTFSHPQLDVANPLTFVLTRKYGCNSTVLPIDTSGITVTDNSFVINLVRLYGGATTKTKVDDGVYNFALYFVYPDPDIALQDNGLDTSACFVVDYLLKCKMLSNNTPELLDKYRAMFFTNDCDDCDCTHLCTIYNDLIEIPTNGTTDCGCY